MKKKIYIRAIKKINLTKGHPHCRQTIEYEQSLSYTRLYRRKKETHNMNTLCS